MCVCVCMFVCKKHFLEIFMNDKLFMSSDRLAEAGANYIMIISVGRAIEGGGEMS